MARRCGTKSNPCSHPRTDWWKSAMGINWFNQGSGVTGESLYLVGYNTDPANRFILLYFDSGVYSSSDNGGVKASDLQLTFNQNGGTATNVTIASVKNTSNTDLSGGELIIRVNITISGTASGVELVTVQPSSSSSITNADGDISTILLNTITDSINKTYDSDYAAHIGWHFDNGNSIPIAEYRSVENDLVIDAKAKGIWQLSDLFYPLSIYGDINYFKSNWKTPGSFNCTVGGTLPFTRGTGYTAGTGYLLTGWIPATNGVNFTLDAASAIHESETNVASTTQIDYGCSHSDAVSTKRIRNMTKDAGSTSQICLNSASTSTLAVVSTSVGLFHQNRSASSAAGHKYYIDGVLADVSNAGSGALPDRGMVLMAEVNAAGTIANISTRKLVMFIFGGNMESLAASIKTMRDTYRNAIAAVTITAKNITTDSGNPLTTDDLNTIITG